MVRLTIVNGFTYSDPAQVRRRWVLPTYAMVCRWTGNRIDAEDLTAWIFRHLGDDFRAPEPARVIEQRLARLTSEAIARHWSERYGVHAICAADCVRADSRRTFDVLTKDLTAEMHLTLVRRFVRRRPIAAIAQQLGVSVEEADRRVLIALAKVAERYLLPAPSSGPPDLGHVSGFISDLVARKRPARFDAPGGTWPVLVAACHVQASIAGNDLPTRQFVSSLESPANRFVTELRISSA